MILSPLCKFNFTCSIDLIGILESIYYNVVNLLLTCKL